MAHRTIKLYSYFNYIRVRSFVLNGAPFLEAEPAKTTGVG